MILTIYNTKQELAEKFAEFFYDFTKGKEEIHVALSGGSTPKIVFEVLAARYSSKINWNKINFYWGDERCVPPSDDQSNYKMTREYLFSKIDIPKSNIHRIKGENLPEDEAIAYSKVLEENIPLNNGVPQFDLLILGMGDDGHTASIFPHQIALWDSDRNCEVAQHPESGQHRITLTGKVINNAARVVFLVTGLAKAEKLREIVREENSFIAYPAALVDPESGILNWYLDREAASQLGTAD
ncbi:MAG: 6-phosphogluconolactonase [Flavobacteriaceae bacterium]